MLRNILLGVGILATLFSVLIFSGKIPVGNKDSAPKGEVVMWGTLPETQMNKIIQEYNPKAKTYAVRYTYVPESEFDQSLLEALAAGRGPDIILADYKRILFQEKRIQPLPVASLNEKSFKDMFVDGAGILYSPQGALALPISVDPMVLFYNRTLFSKHGIVNPPVTWDEVAVIAPSLSIREKGQFIESAIALGTPTTPYIKDIIMAIVLQLGQVPVVKIPTQNGGSYFEVLANDPVVKGGEILPLSTVNRFVTQFGDPGQGAYSWNQAYNNAADVFVGEKLAMYIGYAGEFPTIKSQNPRADFEMTYLPQTKGYTTFSTGMKMYGIATLRSSRNMQVSFQVASDFSSLGVSPAIADIIGAVSARRSYAGTQGLNPVIARSMLVARGWYDFRSQDTSRFVSAMLSDIINYRQGVSDASNMFISRMKDLYSR